MKDDWVMGTLVSTVVSSVDKFIAKLIIARWDLKLVRGLSG